MAQSIDVIIPTLCDPARRDLLLRAIESVRTQEGVEARPIVVVNGARYVPELLDQLKARTDMVVIQIEKPSVFAARRVGFDAVQSEFFAILDDDDLFLPGALARRLAALHSGKADWVASNGIFVRPDGEAPYIPDLDEVRSDPFGTLLEYCWLCSAGNLFRTSAVQADMFDAVRSMEITYIGFRMLAEGRRPAFVDEATFRYFYYPDSLSKMASYNLLGYETIDTMRRTLPLPGWVRRGLARKFRRAMHDLADYRYAHGDVRGAWVAHLRSLSGLPEFFCYAGFTRKLVSSIVRMAFGSSAPAGEPAPVRLTDRP